MNYIIYFLIISFLIIKLLNAKEIQLDVQDRRIADDDAAICINSKCYGEFYVDMGKKIIFYRTVTINLLDDLRLPLLPDGVTNFKEKSYYQWFFNDKLLYDSSKPRHSADRNRIINYITIHKFRRKNVGLYIYKKFVDYSMNDNFGDQLVSANQYINTIEMQEQFFVDTRLGKPKSEESRNTTIECDVTNEQIYINRNNRFSIKCDAIPGEQNIIKYMWRVDNKTILSNKNKYKFIATHDFCLQFIVILKDNKYKDVETLIVKSFQILTDKLIFTTNSNTIEADIGELKKISCYTNTMDEIYWWKDGKPLEMLNGVTKSLHEPNGTFALNVIVNDKNIGTYECRLKIGNTFIANVIQLKKKVLLLRRKRNLMDIRDAFDMAAVDFHLELSTDRNIKGLDLYESARDLNIICLNKNNKLNPLCSEFVGPTKINDVDDRYYRINTTLQASVTLFAVPTVPDENRTIHTVKWYHNNYLIYETDKVKNFPSNFEILDNNLNIIFLKLHDGGFYTYESIINYPLKKYRNKNEEDINIIDPITITRTYYVDIIVAPIISCTLGDTIIYINKNTALKLKCHVELSNPYPIKFLWQNEHNQTLLEDKFEYEFTVTKDTNIKFIAISPINFNDTVILFLVYVNKETIMNINKTIIETSESQHQVELSCYANIYLKEGLTNWYKDTQDKFGYTEYDVATRSNVEHFLEFRMGTGKEGVFECKDVSKQLFYGLTTEITYVPLPTVYPREHEKIWGGLNVYWYVHCDFGKIKKFYYIAGLLNSTKNNFYYENISVEEKYEIRGAKYNEQEKYWYATVGNHSAEYFGITAENEYGESDLRQIIYIWEK